MKKNKIQVFGLQRSGTNYMEWTLKYNFENIDYKNIYIDGNIPGYIRYKERQIVKHTWPTLDYSDFCIIIYKNFNDWKKSMIKYKKEDFIDIKIYNEFIEKSKKLNKNKTLIFEHKYVVNNYIKTIDKISEKFNIKKNKNIIIPEYRVNSYGANVEMTKIKFKL